MSRRARTGPIPKKLSTLEYDAIRLELLLKAKARGLKLTPEAQELVPPTYAELAREVRKRGLEADDLAKHIQNDEPLAKRRALARRILDRRRGDTLISYRTLHRLYLTWTQPKTDPESAFAECECGCGRPLVGQSNKQYATDACRKRTRRQQARLSKSERKGSVSRPPAKPDPDKPARKEPA